MKLSAPKKPPPAHGFTVRRLIAAQVAKIGYRFKFNLPGIWLSAHFAAASRNATINGSPRGPTLIMGFIFPPLFPGHYEHVVAFLAFGIGSHYVVYSTSSEVFREQCTAFFNLF